MTRLVRLHHLISTQVQSLFRNTVVSILTLLDMVELCYLLITAQMDWKKTSNETDLFHLIRLKEKFNIDL